MMDFTDAWQIAPGSQIVVVRATGDKCPLAHDAEVNLLAYVSPLTHQQIMLGAQGAGFGWRVTTAAVGGIEFHDCLLSRDGDITLPRIQGGVLAAISHPWSGVIEITTEHGKRRIDLYSEVARAVVIDVGSGELREVDPKDIHIFREMFKDALADASLADQREASHPKQALAPAAVSGRVVEDFSQHQVLGWVLVKVSGERADYSDDLVVRLAEIEPVAGLVAELGRLELVGDWLLEQSSHVVTPNQRVLVMRSGEFRVRAAPSGSVVFLCGPDSGIVELDIFGMHRRLDLYSAAPKLLRINFDDAGISPNASPAASLEAESLAQRRDFYTAALAKLDSAKPVGLYVPRWRGVAASTRNLFAQTLPFPHTSEGHPSDITPEDVKFLANVLLASRVRHFVISGGDTFWINAIRRVQREDPGIRFDLLWHSNCLQMGEPHDWNLLKNWLRAIADGMVTRVAVVKEGLELMFRRLGADAVFIPNIIRGDPSAIRYNGEHELTGIWLSGSSSYRKAPFATLLALKALTGKRLIGAGFDDDSLAMVTEMRIPRGEIWREPLPQEALHRNIQRTGLTFYITLSECSPMLPLESMHLGVPCLVGPCSHLFRTSPYLYKRLVVENPLSPESIANHARRVLTEGSDVIAAFVEYCAREHAQAERGLARFLS